MANWAKSRSSNLHPPNAWTSPYHSPLLWHLKLHPNLGRQPCPAPPYSSTTVPIRSPTPPAPPIPATTHPYWVFRLATLPLQPPCSPTHLLHPICRLLSLICLPDEAHRSEDYQPLQKERMECRPIVEPRSILPAVCKIDNAANLLWWSRNNSMQ